MSKEKSFWTTLPGILTGIAAVITAIGGLVIVLNQIDLIGPRNHQEDVPRPGYHREDVPRPGNEQEDVIEPRINEEGEQPGQPPSFRVVEAFLRADPFDYVGPSPVTIKFTGRISVVGGGGTVSYKFLRSDGASAPIETLHFDGPESRDVSTTWRLGGPGFTYSGWQSIKILEPQEMESERANFKIRSE